MTDFSSPAKQGDSLLANRKGVPMASDLEIIIDTLDRLEAFDDPDGIIPAARDATDRLSIELTPLEKSIVRCSQWASCGWVGKRLSNRLGVQPAPCPKCGKEVVR